MQNVTRTLTKFKIKAYTVSEDDMTVEQIAECFAMASSMTRVAARAILADEYGEKMPRGCIIKWEPVEQVVYAMPLDEFVANAQILETR